MRREAGGPEAPWGAVEHPPTRVGSGSGLRSAAVVGLTLVAIIGFALQGRVATAEPPRSGSDPATGDADKTRSVAPRSVHATPRVAADDRSGAGLPAGPTPRATSARQPPLFWLVVAVDGRKAVSRRLQGDGGRVAASVALDHESSKALVAELFWSLPVAPDLRVPMATARLSPRRLADIDKPFDLAQGSLLLDGSRTTVRGSEAPRPGRHRSGSRWRYVLRVERVMPARMALRALVTPVKPGDPVAQGAAPDWPRFWLSARGGADLGSIRELQPLGRRLHATLTVPTRALRYPEARLSWSPEGDPSTVPLVTIALPAETGVGSAITRDPPPGSVSLRGGEWIDDAATPGTQRSASPSIRLRYRLEVDATESMLTVRAIVEPYPEPGDDDPSTSAARSLRR